MCAQLEGRPGLCVIAHVLLLTLSATTLCTQVKGMLDLVERDVLLPNGVSFLRLDGSLEASARCVRGGGQQGVYGGGGVDKER